MMVWYTYLIIGILIFGAAFYIEPDKTSDVTKKALDKGSQAISGVVDKIEDTVDEKKGTEEEATTEEESSNPDRIYMGKPNCKDSSDCIYVDDCDDDCICDREIGECYILQ